MGCNPCCCFSIKDSAITIGIWTAVFSVAQLGIMGWQMAAIKYEKDRAANTLLPNYNTYGKFDVPSYYESYWQSPEERYYTWLFIIQILCLISAFFLLCASCALIYGVHTWSRNLIWPWFICIISSILCSLAYCIMWWAGDVRDYWLALTILEIIGVFINIYCTVVVAMYYRRLRATSDEYEGKDRRNSVRYKVNKQGYRNGYSSRRDLLQSTDTGINVRVPEQRSPYMKGTQVVHQPYPSPYLPNGVPQTPLPLPPNYTPYPADPNEMLYNREPRRTSQQRQYEQDPVSSWVKEQRQIASEHGEANSEPISPSREVQPSFPMQHSRSVPELFDGSLVSHKECRHHQRRSSSRHSKRRSRSRQRDRHSVVRYSSDSDSQTEDDRHRRHRSRSRPRYEESEMTDSDHHTRRHDRNRNDQSRHRYDDDGRNSKRSKKRDRGDRDRDREDRGVRDRGDGDRSREERYRNAEESGRRRKTRDDRKKDKRPSGEEVDDFPLSGGITIPQHIVIPPSSGERGPDGHPLPQKFQINSEITINYDKNGRPIRPSEPVEESFRRRYPPMQIQSNV